jgi:hypothetical protein
VFFTVGITNINDHLELVLCSLVQIYPCSFKSLSFSYTTKCHILESVVNEWSQYQFNTAFFISQRVCQIEQHVSTWNCIIFRLAVFKNTLRKAIHNYINNIYSSKKWSKIEDCKVYCIYSKIKHVIRKYWINYLQISFDLFDRKLIRSIPVHVLFCLYFIIYCFPGRNSPQWEKTSPLSRIHDHTPTHHTR